MTKTPMRQHDPIEFELIKEAAEDCLRKLNSIQDAGIRASGIARHFNSGNTTFRITLQCIEQTEQEWRTGRGNV